MFATVAIGLGVVLFGPQSNSPQSNPVRVINAPGITTYSSTPQNRLAEATPNYNTPSNQPLTLGVGKDIPTPSSWGKYTVTPQPQSQWRSRLNEAWRWIQARLEEEWDKKPQQPQRRYVPPQRSYVTPQQNYVQPPQNPYQRIQMGDAQQAQQRLQKQLQFERSQGYDRYAPPPRNGWYPVNPRQNYSRQY